MSNTYRRNDPVDVASYRERVNDPFWHDSYWLTDDEYTQRDIKNPFKPNKKFKSLRKRSRKAKERQALRENREIPVFKKTDTWDWN